MAENLLNLEKDINFTELSSMWILKQDKLNEIYVQTHHHQTWKVKTKQNKFPQKQPEKSNVLHNSPGKNRWEQQFEMPQISHENYEWLKGIIFNVLNTRSIN